MLVEPGLATPLSPSENYPRSDIGRVARPLDIRSMLESIFLRRASPGEPRAHDPLQRAAGLERGGQRAVVEIVELAADRHAMGQPGDRGGAAGQPVDQVMRGGLAIDRRAGGEDDLAHRRIGGAAQQAFDVELVGADAVERRERAAEDVIAAAIGAGALQRPEVADLLDDADQAAVAPWVGADRARLGR